MAELEKELGLALKEQQVESSSAGTPTSPSPRSVEAPQDETQSRERSETTGSRPEELRDACRRDTSAQGLEWEQRETLVAVESLGGRELREEVLVEEEGGVVIRQQGELAGRPAVGDQQNQVEVDYMDDPMDKEATDALPAKQLEIDNHHFRLRGIRTQQLAGRQTKTTQYRVVWGEHPNRSDSWVNEDDVQISMPRLPCKRSSRDLVPHVEMDVVRVHHMRCRRRSKGRKIFEYLVDELSTWITEDQLRLSLSSTLISELRGKSLVEECPSLEELGEHVANGTRLNRVSPSLEPSTI
jgi:hypothetical protein